MTPSSRTSTRMSPSRSTLQRRMRVSGKRLFIGGERSVLRTLRVRATLVAALFLLVVAVFWFDRDGLRDQIDGHITFIDVVYFTMVSVTTLGYGDIVPITAQARIIDALFVTPVRLFIWLIFLGTAYQLVLQQLIEDFRMRRLQSKLERHVIVCGYGHSGRCAAAELAARGMLKQQILIVDVSQERVEEAAEHGYIGILGNAAHEETLREAMLSSARAVFVCTSRDDTNVLIVLTARNLSRGVRIVARVEEAENEKLLKQSGADVTVLPSRVGGILMADSLDSSVLAAYVMDLISAGGRVMLTERQAKAAEVGRLPTELHDSRILRVLRGSQAFGFWEPEARIQSGDVLVVVDPVRH
jgi:voltage-gated potassium channel